MADKRIVPLGFDALHPHSWRLEFQSPPARKWGPRERKKDKNWDFVMDFLGGQYTELIVKGKGEDFREMNVACRKGSW